MMVSYTTSYSATTAYADSNTNSGTDTATSGASGTSETDQQVGSNTSSYSDMTDVSGWVQLTVGTATTTSNSTMTYNPNGTGTASGSMSSSWQSTYTDPSTSSATSGSSSSSYSYGMTDVVAPFASGGGTSSTSGSSGGFTTGSPSWYAGTATGSSSSSGTSATGTGSSGSGNSSLLALPGGIFVPMGAMTMVENTTTGGYADPSSPTNANPTGLLKGLGQEYQTIGQPTGGDGSWYDWLWGPNSGFRTPGTVPDVPGNPLTSGDNALNNAFNSGKGLSPGSMEGETTPGDINQRFGMVGDMLKTEFPWFAAGVALQFGSLIVGPEDAILLGILKGKGFYLKLVSEGGEQAAKIDKKVPGWFGISEVEVVGDELKALAKEYSEQRRLLDARAAKAAKAEVVASNNPTLPTAPIRTGRFGQGSYGSAEESLMAHFGKHGAEVGAKDIDQYLRKAEGFAQNLRGATKSRVQGPIPGVTRYKKLGKYIDLDSNGNIISFGSL